jgi:uncharacterized protein involved in cysteine biosynthesis
MTTLPCPLCGYHAPERECPHCHATSSEPSLARAPRGAFGGLIDGLCAVPMGVRYLMTTPRILHLLVPPVLLTFALFGGLTWWAWHELALLLEIVRTQSLEQLELSPGFWRDAITWVLERGALIALAKASGFLIFLVAASVVALWTFSIAYEAFAGPFLDEIQGRLEARWFGRDPWKTFECQYPTDSRRSAIYWSAIAIASLLGVALWLFADAHAACLLLGPAVALAISIRDRAFGAWLAWWIGAQLRTLFVSLKASALAGVLLLFFFWVKFVPVIGLVLFGMLAGFCTAISLLDIPFSRRRFGLMQRIELLIAHFPAVIGFGAVAGLFFVVPLIGPLVGVPAASIGGLWLICRLDKNVLRPSGAKIARHPSEKSAPAAG